MNVAGSLKGTMSGQPCCSSGRVRWYFLYCLSYRKVQELLAERGIKVDHSTI
jgi:hypothetical protein